VPDAVPGPVPDRSRPRPSPAAGAGRGAGPAGEEPGDIAALAAGAGVRRVHLLAWRDLDDPEAGGSEVHASTIARIWAGAGIEVTMRTSHASGGPAEVTRDGYRVIRRAGRHLVFPRAPLAELAGRHGPRDALVEIWNGMPFLSPLWARGPRVVWLHHVHDEMWDMVLPRPLAAAGKLVERRLAPPLYRRTPVVTLAESSRRELVDDLGLRAADVHVVAPGIDPRFSPGGERSPHPLVVAVGRLVPVKRFDALVDALVPLKAAHPGLEAVIVGEGYERPALEARISAAGAGGWIRLPGRLDDAEVLDLYRRAWVLTGSSVREGWGMTITEAAACGTPAVVNRIGGYADAVVDGETGLLAPPGQLGPALDRVLADGSLRAGLGRAALERARRFTWEATALGTFRVLADAARRRR
ncbi:MAG: glycosyltransferase family 4 protein, partial [Acidimicrobiia bacterium]